MKISRKKKWNLLMSIYIKSGGVLFSIDGVFNIFVCDKSKSSGFISLLIVNQGTALDYSLKTFIFYSLNSFTSSFPYRSKILRNSSSVVLRPKLKTPRHLDLDGSSRSPKWRCFLYFVGETDLDLWRRRSRLPDRLLLGDRLLEREFD